jgi:hypothetical protein
MIDMISACELAGFFAAHAIWCVSTGETLIPMLAQESSDGERSMLRIEAGDLSVAVAQGKSRIESLGTEANFTALLYDGRIPLADGKSDAIIVEIRSYKSPDARVLMAVPYTPKAVFRRFRVHKPKLLQWENCESFDHEAAMVAFFNGVAAHEQGSAIWNKALDESK